MGPWSTTGENPCLGGIRSFDRTLVAEAGALPRHRLEDCWMAAPTELTRELRKGPVRRVLHRRPVPRGLCATWSRRRQTHLRELGPILPGRATGCFRFEGTAFTWEPAEGGLVLNVAHHLLLETDRDFAALDPDHGITTIPMGAFNRWPSVRVCFAKEDRTSTRWWPNFGPSPPRRRPLRSHPNRAHRRTPNPEHQRVAQVSTCIGKILKQISRRSPPSWSRCCKKKR